MTPGKWRNTALSALFEYLVQLLFPVVFLVEAELEGSLERIQHLRPGIDGFVVSVLLDHLHVLQGVQYLGGREAAFRFQLSLEYPVDQQRPVADREMGSDMLLRRHVDRSRAELRLPDPEGLLDLPPLLVHGKDLLRRPVQGRRDGVEAVEAFLLPDSLPIDLVPADLGGLRVLRDMRGLDPSRRVVRAFPPFLEVRAQQLLRTVLAAIGYGKPSKSRVLEAMEGHVTEGSTRIDDGEEAHSVLVARYGLRRERHLSADTKGLEDSP